MLFYFLLNARIRHLPFPVKKKKYVHNVEGMIQRRWYPLPGPPDPTQPARARLRRTERTRSPPHRGLVARAFVRRPQVSSTNPVQPRAHLPHVRSGASPRAPRVRLGGAWCVAPAGCPLLSAAQGGGGRSPRAPLVCRRGRRRRDGEGRRGRRRRRDGRPPAAAPVRGRVSCSPPPEGGGVSILG
jgi:hypothetical protein